MAGKKKKSKCLDGVCKSCGIPIKFKYGRRHPSLCINCAIRVDNPERRR